LSFNTPPTIRWERAVSDFLDELVDLDIRYIDAQDAVERVILAGLHDEITTGVELDGRTLHVHRVPSLFPNMWDLFIVTTVSQNGQISVIFADFADKERRI
jgi:hypothetical protein